MERNEIDQHNQVQRRYYAVRHKKTMVPEDTPYIQRHLAEAQAAIALQPGERVLEVGCGMGRHAIPLAQRGIRIEGIELSPDLLQKMKQYDNGRFNIPAHCADIIDLPVSLRQQFGAVIGFFTLHHMHDLNLVFDAVAGALKPGGRVAFVEPNPWNPLYYFQITFKPGMSWAAQKGTLQMRRGVLFTAMKQAGLANLRLIRYGFFPPFLHNIGWGEKLGNALERVPLWKGMLPFTVFAARKG